MRIDMIKNARYIIDTLEDNGFDAFIVGGCVRDQMLGIRVSDYDITTNAKPNEIKKLFKKTVDTGIEHGTITVIINTKDKTQSFEVTTFRIDGAYIDGRHPSFIKFVDELYYDLSRRDFTINAMAYNDKYGLIDKYGGVKDIKQKLIKAVGNPEDRFNEDALRMLRAIRFAARFGFKIEDSTRNAIIKFASNIKRVSKERIHNELDKIITSNNPQSINLLVEYGLAKYIAKDFDKINLDKIFKTDKLYMGYISLFYGTEIIPKKILRELKYDVELIKHVDIILTKVNDFKKIINNNQIDMKLKMLISEIGYDNCYDLIKIVSFKESMDLSNIFDKVMNFETMKEPIFISDLNIDGYDLMSLGIKGKKVGEVLYELQKKVHSDKTINVKDKLMELAMEV